MGYFKGIMGFVVPVLVGAITANMNFTSWKVVFSLAAGIYTICNFIYVFMIDGKPQEWNFPENNLEMEENNEKLILAPKVEHEEADKDLEKWRLKFKFHIKLVEVWSFCSVLGCYKLSIFYNETIQQRWKIPVYLLQQQYFRSFIPTKAFNSMQLYLYVYAMCQCLISLMDWVTIYVN